MVMITVVMVNYGHTVLLLKKGKIRGSCSNHKLFQMTIVNKILATVSGISFETYLSKVMSVMSFTSLFNQCPCNHIAFVSSYETFLLY